MSSATREDDKGSDGTQRLDKWLWYARVVKSRTLAAALVTDGKVRVNRTRAEKPSQSVKAGDVVTVTAHRQVHVWRVLAPGLRRGPPAEARLLYEDLTPAPAAPAGPASTDTGSSVAAQAQRAPGSGRPTKRDRRAMDSLRGRDT